MRMISVVLTGALATSSAMAHGIDDLADFRWDHRIIMVFSGDRDPGPVVEYLGTYQAEIDDRDILWFVVGDEGIETNYRGILDTGFADALTARYHASGSSAGQVVLVGKDGGVKYRSDRLEPEIIFGRIDQMPMRRAEMRRKSGY